MTLRAQLLSSLLVPPLRIHLALMLSALLVPTGCAVSPIEVPSGDAATTDFSHHPGVVPDIRLPAGERARGLVLITVDTLRSDFLSSYGHTRILTPSFDRLAAGGVLFRQAISQSTTTTPSHASLMTSLYLHDHNVYSNFDALGADPATLAEIFAARGYATFAIANMRHLNPEVGGLGRGFQTFIKSGFMRRAESTMDIFLDWLGKQKDAQGNTKPFFAWIHLADVHTPYRPPPPYDHFYYDADERDPANQSLARVWPLLPTHMSDHPFFKQWLEGITDLEWVKAQYQGAVTYVDDEIGRLMDALERRQLLGKTAIVCTADHGEALGEHDMYFVHTGLYEPTVRVPLLMYFPGSARQGTVVREVVETVDVMPTVLEYFGMPAPANIRGQSLWPLMRGEVQPERVALSEHAGKNLVALRSDRFKYIKHLRTANLQPSYPFVEGHEELYDLRDDPYEMRNLAKSSRDVLQVFRKELERRERSRLALQTGRAEVSAETVEVLRALGYVH